MSLNSMTYVQSDNTKIALKKECSVHFLDSTLFGVHAFWSVRFLERTPFGAHDFWRARFLELKVYSQFVCSVQFQNCHPVVFKRTLVRQNLSIQFHLGYKISFELCKL